MPGPEVPGFLPIYAGFSHHEFGPDMIGKLRAGLKPLPAHGANTPGHQLPRLPARGIKDIFHFSPFTT